jgi:hypothetical protein
MKTVVYQSYRTHDVPGWMTRCMLSVRAWSESQHYEYRFIDDSLFDYVPGWYRSRAGPNVQVVSNLARLLVAKELLAAGYERTIWIDADILVFDEGAFRIETASDFAFCHEVWITARWGSLIRQAGVNNSVSVFVRGNCFLDFCIWAHEDLVRRGTQILAHGTSTRLLTALDRAVPLPVLTNVGVLSPVVAHDVRHGGSRVAKKYAAFHGAPIHAVNLGGSLCGKPFDGRVLGNDDYDAIVAAIETTRGAMFTGQSPA